MQPSVDGFSVFLLCINARKQFLVEVSEASVVSFVHFVHGGVN
jgi:hypothetical protein